jgi:predicted TIM-barrel fold metal-dependent hydrolase
MPLPAEPVPLIDVHAHALLPLWCQAAARARGQTAGTLMIAGTPAPDWSPAAQLAVMDRHGIAASVLSWPSATSFLRGEPARRLARDMNEQLAEIVARHPRRFGAFAVLPLDDMDAAIAEMAYALDVLGLDGVSSSTHVDGVYLGDARYEAWFAEMDRRGCTLFVHPTTPKGFDLVGMGLNASILEFMFDSTRMATQLVASGAKARHPRVNIICTHGGGTVPYLATRVSVLAPHFAALEGRPMPTGEQILAGFASFHYDLTASTAAASQDALRRLVPATQLMLGFDYPMMHPSTIAPSLQRFADYQGWREDERRAILHGTAQRLLPRLAGVEGVVPTALPRPA